MNKSEEPKIPPHRAAFPTRTGDAIVNGSDGKPRNVDQEARDAAAASLSSGPSSAGRAASAPLGSAPEGATGGRPRGGPAAGGKATAQVAGE